MPQKTECSTVVGRVAVGRGAARVEVATEAVRAEREVMGEATVAG